MEDLAQALGISHGRVSTILHDRLGMRKLTARWVPKSLSDEQMASVCSALLKRLRSKDDFLLRLVTIDETWVHYYEPENKAQWVGPGSPRPKNFKTQPFAVMATVFWDAKGIIVLDFLPNTCKVAMDAVERNGYEFIPHPAYSPDLAPGDFFVLPNVLRGLHFRLMKKS